MGINGYVTGEPVRLSATFTTLAGVLTDATIICKVRDAAGATTTISGASIVHDSTGAYHTDYTPAAGAGEYFYRFEASGALVAAYEGQFQVLKSEF